MYDQNDRLTIDGAKTVIRNGGSVLIGGQLHNTLATLPSAAKLSTFNAVTREQAENAIKTGGSFTYNGKTYNSVKDLPAAEEFEAQNRKARKEAADQLQAEIDERQEQLDEANRLTAEANEKTAQAEQLRAGTAQRTGTGRQSQRSTGRAAGAAGGAGGDDEEQFGHTDTKYPLSAFDTYETADDIVAANAEGKFSGIGDATAHEIIAARKKRDRAK